jgi:hypothetical protein
MKRGRRWKWGKRKRGQVDGEGRVLVFEEGVDFARDFDL